MHLPGKSNERQLGMILGFGTLLWSGSYVALAKGLTPFLSPITLLLLSETLVAIYIVMTFGLVPLLRELLKMTPTAVGIAMIVGLLNSAIMPYLWFTGLSMTSAANASLLSSADVIVVLLLGWLILKENVTGMQLIGIAVAMLGIVIINLGIGTAGAFTLHKGDLYIVLGSVASGAGAVLFKRHLSHVMPEAAILIRNLTAMVIVSVIAFAYAMPLTEEVARFPVEKVLLLLAFTFFSRYLNLVFFYESLDRLPATTFSMIQVGAPLSGLVFASLLLGEQILPYHVLGALFIICGLFLEQTSAQSIRSFRDRHFFQHLHFWHRKKPTADIGIVPKHV